MNTTTTTLTLDQALQLAIRHHQSGQLQEAERLYRAILAQQPQHPDANHNLGQLARQVGQPQAALPFLQRALQANPGVAQYWLSVIGALADCGHSDAARQMIEEAQRRGLPDEALAPLLDRLPQRASSQAAENDGVATPAAASLHTQIGPGHCPARSRALP